MAQILTKDDIYHVIIIPLYDKCHVFITFSPLSLYGRNVGAMLRSNSEDNAQAKQNEITP